MAEDSVAVSVPMEAPPRRPSLFRRLFGNNRARQENQQMDEYTADAWLATTPQTSNEPIEEEVLTKSSVKLEAIMLVVNLVRSSIKVGKSEKDGSWQLTCFTDGLASYAVEVWKDGKKIGQTEMNTGLTCEARVSFELDLEPVYDQGIEVQLVLRAKQDVNPILSAGKMMAGVQINNLTILLSRDQTSYETRLTRQKVLLSEYEIDMFEIFGQPHNMMICELDTNLSTSSFFSYNNVDLPGYNRECVVCLSQRRDTLFLPCRHMCLCLSCAESLCMHSDKCPICRQGMVNDCMLILSFGRVPVNVTYSRFVNKPSQQNGYK